MKGLCSSFIRSTAADAGTTETVDSIVNNADVVPQNEDSIKWVSDLHQITTKSYTFHSSADDEENFVRYEITWKSDGRKCTWWGPPPTEGGSSTDASAEGPGDIIRIYDKETKKMVPLPAGFVAPARVEDPWAAWAEPELFFIASLAHHF